ncbi:MAG TPA: MATE family efflux transporter [Candidatus Sulfotelmatobacter sp.]|nr:MATE family efflux transporter [Candidatus Sulfotelmatobacter sp.]
MIEPRPGAVAAAPAGRPTLWSLAWPIFIEQGLRVLIGTVDTLMVSHIGDDAVAGLSVANQIVILFIISFAFIGVGSSVVITHHLGAHDRTGADRIAATAIATNLWIGLGVSLLVTVFSTPMLHWMQVPAGPMVYAKPFLALMGGTLFIESMNVSIAAILRAHTHTRDAMLVTLGQNILNVLGNCLLLFGLFGCPKLGVVGVALSSVFSRLVANVALWWLLARRTHWRLRWREFVTIHGARVRRILHIGLPAAGENLSYWLAFMVVTTFVARMGATPLATQNYTLNLELWVILLNVSIGMGTEILIGHLIGAGQFETAYRDLLRNLRLALVCAVGGMAVLALVAPWLLGTFTRTPAIIASGTVLLRLGLLLEPGRVFNVVIINGLRATGDARFPVIVGVVCMWCGWVPLAWLLGLKLGLGLVGIWISLICDEWTRGLLMYYRWRRRLWLPAAERSFATPRETAIADV